jgi:hypothetical protein
VVHSLYVCIIIWGKAGQHLVRVRVRVRIRARFESKILRGRDKGLCHNMGEGRSTSSYV